MAAFLYIILYVYTFCSAQCARARHYNMSNDMTKNPCKPIKEIVPFCIIACKKAIHELDHIYKAACGPCVKRVNYIYICTLRILAIILQYK